MITPTPQRFRFLACPRRRFSRPTVTGAATIWLRVNMAAAEAPSGIRARAKSGLPLALMPAAQAEKRNPCGGFLLTPSA